MTIQPMVLLSLSPEEKLQLDTDQLYAREVKTKVQQLYNDVVKQGFEQFLGHAPTAKDYQLLDIVTARCINCASLVMYGNKKIGEVSFRWDMCQCTVIFTPTAIKIEP